MQKAIIVREYAELTTASVQQSMDLAQIPKSCFDWIIENLDVVKNAFSKKHRNHATIKLGSYVGIIESPCGTSIEVLPKYYKHTPTDSEILSCRKTLIRMIGVCLKLPYKEAGIASIETFRQPIHEWVLTQFLLKLDTLYKKGIRFQYQRVEEESLYLRGQLNVNAQVRQSPTRKHIFNIRHDVFNPNRPENKLLKSALEIVRKQVKQADNWRLANELSHLLEPIETSSDYKADFKQWKNDRLMADYNDIKVWCELILNRLNPFSQKGKNSGVSMMFPMEKLFEEYVAHTLKRTLSHGVTLTQESSSHFLCSHQPINSEKSKRIFQLRPDLLIKKQSQTQVLDCKWKLINAESVDDKYGIKQNDMYQMFAYGHKYMNGTGKVVLIYPKTSSFSEPLPDLHFDDRLSVKAIPFDIETSQFIDKRDILGM